MNRMRNLSWSRWRTAVDTFFTAPQSAAFLSAYRIGTASMGLVVVLSLAPSLLDIYGAEGFIQWVVSNELFRIPTLPSLVQLSPWGERLGVTPDVLVLGAFAVYVGCLIGLLLGWHTRAMAAGAWILHGLIGNTSIIFGYGVETFIHMGLFYTMIMPSAEYWSLDARAGRRGHARVSAAARIGERVIQIHLCIVYLNAGLAKLMGSDWWTGEAIWRSVTQPDFRQFDLTWMAWVPWLSTVIGWSVLLLECAYPIAIWHPRTRRWWLGGTVAMHLGIALCMGLWMFALMMIVMNVVGFGWTDVSTMAARVRAWHRARRTRAIALPAAVG